MKTAILRTAILAVIALPLTVAGSAFAMEMELYGEAFLYYDSIDKELADDIYNAYYLEIQFHQFNYEPLDAPYSVSFQFRSDDELTWDYWWHERGWEIAYSGIYDCNGSCFEISIDGLTFSAGKIGDGYCYDYNDACYGIEYSYDSFDDIYQINTYSLGFANGSPAELHLLISNDPNYYGYSDSFPWTAILWVDVPDSAPIPEPGTLVLLGTGLLGAAAIVRRKMKK